MAKECAYLNAGSIPRVLPAEKEDSTFVAENARLDNIGGCAKYPDMAEKANSDNGRQLAQQYLEAHDAVPAGHCLDQLCRSVIKRAQGGRLPIDSHKVERQVCALAWSGCTEDGIAFAEKAQELLSDTENPNHPLVEYQIALERGDKEKLERLNRLQQTVVSIDETPDFLIVLPGKGSNFYSIDLTPGKQEELEKAEK